MRLFLAILCLLAFGRTLPADSLSQILSRMDQSAPQFHGATANLVMDTYQKILDAHTNESGTLKMQRSAKGDVRAVIEFVGNSARTLSFAGKNVRIYYPNINQYQDVSLGSNASVVNQYLLLGFGSSGKDLEQNYIIKEEGQEKVSGQNAAKLLLVPKDANLETRLTKVQLWIPDGASNPIQQQFYEPSGNYRLITYSNLLVNPAMAHTLEFKMPKGATKSRQ